MKVAIVYDNTQRPDTTGEHCLQALRGLCEVQHFLPTQMDEVPRASFDLHLQIDDGLRYRFPLDLRPSAWWVIDTHLQYDWDRQKASDFDFVFAAQRDGAERLEADWTGPVQWLPLACNPAVHRPHEVDKDLKTQKSHEIGKRVEAAISEMPAVDRAFIHLDPR